MDGLELRAGLDRDHAQAEVSVRLESETRTFTGRGADTDTLVASAKAYISALNKLLLKQGVTSVSAAAAP